MKTQTKVAIFGALALLTYGTGYVQGQNKADFENYQTSPVEENLIKARVQVRDVGGYENLLRLSEAYMQSVSDRAATREVIRSAQANKSASVGTLDLMSMQIAQNQKMIEQNAEMIELLKAKTNAGRE